METKDDDHGLHTWSQVKIQVDVKHDGDPELLEERLAREVERVILASTDLVLMGLTASVSVRSAST